MARFSSSLHLNLGGGGEAMLQHACAALVLGVSSGLYKTQAETASATLLQSMGKLSDLSYWAYSHTSLLVCELPLRSLSRYSACCRGLQHCMTPLKAPIDFTKLDRSTLVDRLPLISDIPGSPKLPSPDPSSQSRSLIPVPVPIPVPDPDPSPCPVPDHQPGPKTNLKP